MTLAGDAVLSLGGVALLWIGARWFVAGAAALARAAGVSTLVVGLTVVAFGTSAPELVVSAGAAFEGQADVAAGNVVGSNVFNLALVLGVVAVLQPFQVTETLLRRDAVAMAVATGLGIAALGNRFVSRLEGAILVALLVGYLAWLWLAVIRSTDRDPTATPFLSASRDRRSGSERGQSRNDSRRSDSGDPRRSRTADRRRAGRYGLEVGRLLAGLAFVVGGGRLLVDGATGLALSAGVSEWVVGVTVVAGGTSLPELVTSIVATRRGNVAIAAGNVIGSNVFNLLGVLGIAALVRPLAVAPVVLPGLAWLGLVTAVASTVLASGRQLTRLEGVGLLAIGASYWVWSAIG